MKKTVACEHELIKERIGGMDTGDKICRKCGETFTPEEATAIERKLKPGVRPRNG